MEDETTQEENHPSTSKKESHDRTNGNDYDERGRDPAPSNSETSVTATYSARSRIDMVVGRPTPPKPVLGKREPKLLERKERKRVRRSGKVEKRRPSFYRRHIKRRRNIGGYIRRKANGRKGRAELRRIREQDSVSTIFTRLSSWSGSRAGCVYCGHRCCRRRYRYGVMRYEYTRRRCTCGRHRNRRMPKKKIVGAKKLKKKQGIKFFERRFPGFSKQIQIGSRCHMLSPLFVNTNSTPGVEMILPTQMHCEVSPEMIFESLCVLNLWKQNVETILILKYIMRNYPVNNVEKELFVELKEKLRIASLVGIVTQTNEDYWALAGELERRQLTDNHVTLFWKVYADTLRPLPKREAILQKERSELPDKRKGDEFGGDLV